MSNIAVIPARGGSKRIYKKNVKSFAGKPIIAYSIETALQSGLFDEVMVSTDDEEIASVAKKFGAKVPFYRSRKNSNDYAALADVVIEVAKDYEQYGKKYKYICCILPTAPFVNDKLIKESFNKLINSDFDSVFPVVKYSYPIQRALHFVSENIQMIWPENFTMRSQDLADSYHDAGMFYWIEIDSLYMHKRLWTEKSGAIIVSEIMAHDIDTYEDWKVAEVKYKMLNEIK